MQERKNYDYEKILEYIKQHQPISIYKLAKDLNAPYSSMYNIIRDLELIKKVKTRIAFIQDDSKIRRSFNAVRLVEIHTQEGENENTSNK